MANVNAPRGFLPVRHKDGSPYNGQHDIFYIPAADGTAVYVGDVVILAGAAGTAGTIVSGMDLEGVATVTRATTGATGQNIAGVVVGFLVDPTQLQVRYRPASTARVALVVTDPTAIYEVQEDAVTTPLQAADIGLNISFSVTAGSAASGQSGMQLISAAKATTVGLPLKLLGLAKRPDNAFNTAGAGTDNAKFEVMFNTGVFQPNVLGV